MDEAWMELADVAQLLGRTERQVLRYAKDGKVATRRVGRRYQYRRDEVERLAEELEPVDATRRDTIAPDVGRALVEVVGVQRELIEAQREIMELRRRVQVVEQQRLEYIRIISELQKQNMRIVAALQKRANEKPPEL